MSQIPEIIDNRKFLLKDTINDLLKYSRDVNIATGYFYLSGFELIKENINDTCKINIVIGNETDSITAEEIDKGYKRNLSDIRNAFVRQTENLDERQKKNVHELAELIRMGIIDFKIYDKDKFHSKAYIFDVEYNNGDFKDSYAIVGSSNFSKRGLGIEKSTNINTELNVVLRQPSAVEKVKEWFDTIWSESENFKYELLNVIENKGKVETLSHSPFDIILKTLYELFKNENSYTEINSLNLNGLTEFQTVAVKKALKILENYNGVIIADSVGLGKTYIAKGILSYFQNENVSTLIICPASLAGMWKKETNELKIGIDIITQESIGINGINTEKIRDKQVIIIDEVHNFRNENTKRFKELIKVTADKKIVELTATPINNSIMDLYNILTLFVKEDEFKNKYGIQSLKRIFMDYENNKDKINNILNEIMIRRSKSYVRNKYSNKGLLINGKQIKFPRRHISKIGYKIERIYGGNLFSEIANILQNLNLPIVSKEKLSEKQIFISKVLIKVMLLKRFESSVEAFRKSIIKQRDYCQALTEALGKGFLIYKGDFIKNYELIDIDYAGEYSRSDLTSFQGDIHELTAEVRQDEYNLNLILDKIRDIDNQQDAKLKKLLSYISEDLKGKKILIFTQFKDTARYIYDYLSENEIKSINEMDSQRVCEKERTDIVFRFSPKANSYNMVNKSPIDILVSTDVLSEGLNLQDCNIIINYDLPWNPVRIIQREGRIDRITTEFSDIYVYNFIPDDKLEELLKLMKKLYEKINYINDTVGNEDQIISDDEVINDKIFNDNDIYRIIKISNNDRDILYSMEEEKDDIIKTEENIYCDFVDLISTKEKNRLKAENLPDGIYSVVTNKKYKGIYMYYKTNLEDYLMFYDLKNDSFITNKGQVYEIISKVNFPGIRPAKQNINTCVDEILKKGYDYVLQDIERLRQYEASTSKLGLVQRNIAKRVDKIIRNKNSRKLLTKEKIKIIRKINEPMHKGMESLLRNIDLNKASDKELVETLLVILGKYKSDKKTSINESLDDSITLICYEVFM